MSRLQPLFDRKRRGVLNVYCTAGFPRRDDTLPVLRALEGHGADIIELGMPYSDPLADGPVIQRSNATALANGMSIPLLFSQLEALRPSVGLPVILMGYLNPILQYGFERFCADAARVGIDGLILPDLPEYEYEHVYGPIIRAHGLDFSFLVTPETSEERVRRLDALSNGFLYAVSSSSTTGGDSDMGPVEGYLGRLRKFALRNPVLVGFGIRDRGGFLAACKHAEGAIIGSAYIRALEAGGDVDVATERFLQAILT
ncbi:MAG: tryptophan synthase subunit alpha [Chitinophagia bacterium]|nr:tryptophan synthase subunit alpha [Chitinophagia bacterium]